MAPDPWPAPCGHAFLYLVVTDTGVGCMVCGPAPDKREAVFPDGCPVPAPDDHCSCFQAEETCSPDDPCCRHSPDFHDPEDDSPTGLKHQQEIAVSK